MNKKKNIVSIVLTIISMLLITIPFLKVMSSFGMYSIIDDNTIDSSVNIADYLFPIFILTILPGIFLIKYIGSLKNEDKYYNLNKLQNTLIFNNVIIITFGIIDYIYNMLFLNKLSSNIKFFGVFTYKYLLIFELFYFIFTIWIIVLRKDKIKLSKNIVLKLINNWIFITISTITLLFGDIQLLLIPLLLEIVFMIIPSRKIIYNSIFNIILLIINIALVVLIVTDSIYIDLTALNSLLYNII